MFMRQAGVGGMSSATSPYSFITLIWYVGLLMLLNLAQATNGCSMRWLVRKRTCLWMFNLHDMMLALECVDSFLGVFFTFDCACSIM